MKRYCKIAFVLLFDVLLLLSCTWKNAESVPSASSRTIFAMDTVMQLTVYGDAAVLDEAEELIFSLEEKLSVTGTLSRLTGKRSFGIFADRTELSHD